VSLYDWCSSVGPPIGRIGAVRWAGEAEPYRPSQLARPMIRRVMPLLLHALARSDRLGSLTLRSTLTHSTPPPDSPARPALGQITN
jgi:hypothetical protein